MTCLKNQKCHTKYLNTHQVTNMIRAYLGFFLPRAGSVTFGNCDVLLMTYSISVPKAHRLIYVFIIRNSASNAFFSADQTNYDRFSIC